MSNAAPVIIKTNPHRPVDFKESAIMKVLKESGNLNLEVKEDGCQVNMMVIFEKNPFGNNQPACKVLFLSREGKEFNGLKDLGSKLSGDERWLKFFNEHLEAGLFANQGGFMLQAEVLTMDENGNDKVCAEIAGDLRRMEPIPLNRLRFVAFDLIPMGAVRAGTEYEVFQEVRRGHTSHQVGALNNRFPELNIKLVESLAVFAMTDLNAVYERFRTLKKEGGVAKDPLGYWKRGKKTGQWKIKPDDECDGVITGLMWGTPGLANEGKVIGFRVLTEHGVEVDAGGITEAQKEEFTGKVLDAIPQAYFSSPEWDRIGDNPSVCKEWFMAAHDCNPFKDHAVKITYMERLPSGSYRHPNFDSFRGITDPKVKE